jgi:hypothetical protein
MRFAPTWSCPSRQLKNAADRMAVRDGDRKKV